MKLSNKEIVNSVSILGAISQKQLPVRVSYVIAKNIINIQEELKVYNVEREKLIKKYSELDEDGNTKIENGSIKLKDDCINNWNKDMEELLNIENEINIQKFKMAEFTGKACDFSPSELLTLDYMIEG